MLKKLSTLLLLVPTMASAHDWDSEYWLDRLVRNHNKVIDCQLLIQDNDIDGFRAKCSTHVMSYQENVLMDEFEAAGNQHVDDLDGFVFEHFDEMQILILSQNLRIYEAIEAIIVSHYIVEGLTRDVGTKHFTQAPTSEIDEGAGND